MALPEFKDENEFRVNWIRPFLSKLGYMSVTHSHGSDEHGRDHFFADVDRFEHLRFYAVQAKNSTIRANNDLRTLFTQIDTCFDVPLTYSGEERRISGVYVMTTQKITLQAQVRIDAWRRRKDYGGNVFVLDGERLELLNQRCDRLQNEEKRRILMAVWRECLFNHHVTVTAQLSTPGSSRSILRRCFTSATQHAIASLDDYAFADELESLLYSETLFNGLLDVAISGSAQFDRALGGEIVEAATKAKEQIKSVVATVVAELMELEASRTIEVSISDVS